MKIKEWFECLSQTDSFYTEIWEDKSIYNNTLFYGEYDGHGSTIFGYIRWANFYTAKKFMEDVFGEVE